MNPLNREVCKTGQHGYTVLAHRTPQATSAFTHGKDGSNLRTSLLAADMDPVLASDNDRTHRVFCHIVAQLDYRVFQEPHQFVPKRQRVTERLAQCTRWQNRGFDSFDLNPEQIDNRTRTLLPQRMTGSVIHARLACLRVGRE